MLLVIHENYVSEIWFLTSDIFFSRHSSKFFTLCDLGVVLCCVVPFGMWGLLSFGCVLIQTRKKKR